MSNPMPPEYYSLLEEIQGIDFVLVELNLYLDTHPNDAEAIQQYNEAAQISMQLKINFEKKFGPLHHFGHSYSNYPWSWNSSPWPWQV